MSIEQPLTPELVKDTVRRHWDGRAETFDDLPNHGLHSDEQRTAWLERLSAWAGKAPVDALDLGTGTGFLALMLADLGHRVTGIDVAPEMLNQARAKAAGSELSVNFLVADAEQLDFPDGSFDLIVERHVIWTLPEPSRALQEWRRILKPGGRLVLIEGDWRTAPNADYAPIKDALPLYGGRPAEELASLVETNGYAPLATEPLMEAILWGETPQRERYALHAWKPAT